MPFEDFLSILALLILAGVGLLHLIKWFHNRFL